MTNYQALELTLSLAADRPRDEAGAYLKAVRLDLADREFLRNPVAPGEFATVRDRVTGRFPNLIAGFRSSPPALAESPDPPPSLPLALSIVPPASAKVTVHGPGVTGVQA